MGEYTGNTHRWRETAVSVYQKSGRKNVSKSYVFLAPKLASEALHAGKDTTHISRSVDGGSI